jgi:hypothetical protein
MFCFLPPPPVPVFGTAPSMRGTVCSGAISVPLILIPLTEGVAAGRGRNSMNEMKYPYTLSTL